MVSGAIEACKSLADFPHRGAPRYDLDPGVRLLRLERRITIAYRVLEPDVEILGVFYRGRDLSQALRED